MMRNFSIAMLISAALFVGCDSSATWEYHDFSGQYEGDITYSYRTQDGETNSATEPATWTVKQDPRDYTLEIDISVNLQLTPELAIPANLKRTCHVASVPGIGDYVCQIASIVSIQDYQPGPRIVLEASSPYRIRFGQSISDTVAGYTGVSGTLTRTSIPDEVSD